MKYLTILLFLFVATQPPSVVEWLTETEHDFGDIKQGQPVTVDFRFKNTSEEPITIDNVRSTCGCTASEWEETVIEPGKESKVKIEFDAKKLGYFHRKITVFFSNQTKAEKLYITGYVE